MADRKKTYGLPVIHKKAQKKCCLNCDHGTETYHYVICDMFERRVRVANAMFITCENWKRRENKI